MAATRILSTTPLLSRAGLRGVFDPATEKCPPDRGGSVEHVRGVLPSVLSSKPLLSARPPPGPLSTSAPAASSPRPIPYSANHANNRYPITPPLTPDSIHSAASSSLRSNSVGSLPTSTDGEPPTFLTSLFPEHVPAAQHWASPIRINSQPDSAWEGFVLDLPGKPKTLYVNGNGAGQNMLRESVVALLDLADEHFNCSALVIALPRTTNGLDQLIHSLMYVGGQVVTHSPFKASSSYVLIGMEI